VSVNARIFEFTGQGKPFRAVTIIAPILFVFRISISSPENETSPSAPSAISTLKALSPSPIGDIHNGESAKAQQLDTLIFTQNNNALDSRISQSFRYFKLRAPCRIRP
jgi:hypothetical protein